MVAKLFNLVRPHAAVFGQKDYQQLAIIRRMVRDLNFPLEIIGVRNRREPDGLALSSRNVYLTPDERAQAPVLRRALLLAGKRVRAGERDAGRFARCSKKNSPRAALGAGGLRRDRGRRRSPAGRRAIERPRCWRSRCSSAAPG